MAKLELINYPNKPKTDSFLLDVPYNPQIDNSNAKGQGEGYRQCNLTSAAMLAKYFYPTLWSQYQDFANGMQDVLAPFGDTTDHNAVTKALLTLGIESEFSYSASLTDLAQAQYQGVPVLIGVAYKNSGHMILVIGREPGMYIAHDPYGSRAGTSNSWNAIGGAAGKLEKLSPNWMRTCFVDQGPDTGWARFVTKVGGVPTGVKSGM